MQYRELRPTLAIPAGDDLRIPGRTGLHPSLESLMPAWRAAQLAIVQGVGYAMPNRSHFRSQQIWRTASPADEYRTATGSSARARAARSNYSIRHAKELRMKLR